MQYVSIKDAAEMLGVHRNTIRNWIRDGKLPVVKLSSHVHRIDLNELKKLVQS